MISRLRGLLLAKTPPCVLVEVGGIGYEVSVPMTSLYQLPEAGQEVILFTHQVIREDAQLLYGFANTRDRELFRTLIKVNGVGPKMALAIMSGMDTAELLRCVRSDNVKALSQIPGIGKKTAERLVIELRDRLTDWDDMATGGAERTEPRPTGHDAIAEAESALVALGYKPADAARMVHAVAQETAQAGSEALIRLALRSAVKV